MRRALERHGDGAARVVPIVVKPCDWQDAPFGSLQALPRDGRPVTSWDDPEEAWMQVAKELRALVDEHRERHAGSPPAIPEPRFPSERIRAWSRALKDVYLRQEALIVAGQDAGGAEEEIKDLRRRLREGGLQPGDLLDRGRFQLIDTIGSGGFATVWKAYDRRRRTAVAVKVLHSQYARDASRRERFFRGAREMASLHHPGIVRVIEEQGRDGRFHFFVMELVDDGDLQRAVRDRRLPDVHEQLRLVLEVGEALAFAHQRGVIHRDVKPANVLLDAAGRARLTDFDLVRAADSSAGTRTGSMLGTFVYAAPEVLVNAKEADVRADVYGLGMTAVYAVHGGNLPPDVFRDGPGFVSRLAIDRSVRDVLSRAVAWKAGERFASVEAFCAALREGFDASPAPQPPSRRRRRKKGSAATESALEELFHWIETPHDGRVELWRRIPAGTFWMGSPEGEGDDDERPRHQVTVTKPFRMAVVTVTNAQFAAFDPNHEPKTWKGVSPEELAFHPVIDVSWRLAMDFCSWLEGRFSWARGARLPTEEEWEYACRAGSETRYWSGDAEEDLKRVGWYSGNAGGRTHRVGEKPANAWGLFDVHGNVWEWTLGTWTSDYSKKAMGIELDPIAVEAAKMAGTGSDRVVRGGGFWNYAVGARAASRSIRYPVLVNLGRGFRVMLPPDPAAPSS